MQTRYTRRSPIIEEPLTRTILPPNRADRSALHYTLKSRQLAGSGSVQSQPLSFNGSKEEST